MVQDMEAQFNIVSVGMNDEDKGMFGISWKNCGKSQAWTNYVGWMQLRRPGHLVATVIQ